MSDAETETRSPAEQGGSSSGKIIVVGVVLAIVGGMGAIGSIGYSHAMAAKKRRAELAAGHERGTLDGQQLYAKYCVSCHKESGVGNASFGYPNLQETQLSAEQFATWVKTGGPNGKMQAFEGTFTEKELAQLYDHVRTLKTE